MQLTIDDVVYRVWWSYDVDDHHPTHGGVATPATRCTIVWGRASYTHEEWDRAPRVISTVRLWVHDKPNKNKARKFAMAKALRILFLPEQVVERGGFWRAYRAQLGHW